jgi:hypothetical protein
MYPSDLEKNIIRKSSDFILTIDYTFIRQSLLGYFINEYKKLTPNEIKKYKNLSEDLYRTSRCRYNYDSITFFINEKRRNIDESFFYQILFEELKFPKKSNIYIESIPDYDLLNHWESENDWSVNDYYTTLTGIPDMEFFINHLTKNMKNDFESNGDYKIYYNGSLLFENEPWYEGDLGHLKISLTNNSYIVSYQNYLELVILYENTENEYHPDNINERLNYNNINFWKYCDDKIYNFSENENIMIKNELSNIFKIKQFSNLYYVFHRLYNSILYLKVE